MISFYKPTIKRKDMDGVLQTLVDEEIGCGSRTIGFVQSFCQLTGCLKGCALRSYKMAIVEALKNLGATCGSRIGLSPLTPVIYLKALEELECTPVYIDIDKENGCPDNKKVEESKVDILVLYEPECSIPVKYNNETTFAEKVEYLNVKVIEDISSSIGSHVLNNLKAGCFGDLVICSFEDKNVVSASGGAILASNFQDFYFKPSEYDQMTDLNSSLGLVQLENLEENSLKRRDILKIYQQELTKTPYKQFGLLLLDFESNSSSFSVSLDSKPDETISFAKKYDVPVTRTFDNSICSVYEGDLFEAFPISAAIFYRTVSFPIYPFLKDSEIDTIKKVIAHLP